MRVVGEPPPSAAAPARSLGEHAEQVLVDILGYDAPRIAELSASGVPAGSEHQRERSE